MLKWFLTFSFLALAGWWWLAGRKKLLQRYAVQRQQAQAKQPPAGKPQKVVQCHLCDALLPPELVVHYKGVPYCQEHAPADANRTS